MGLLRLTSPVDPYFECEVVDIEKKAEAYMVRPCERYKELFQSCRSIRGRLHQYYVYGELFDCSQMKNLHNYCLEFRKTQNVDLLDPIIDWEKKLMNQRLKASKNNPVWEPRDEPPSDFDQPLPDFLSKRQSNSIFSKLKEEN